MKPESWRDCPSAVLEIFLASVDLDYDPYEGSRAEEIDAILNQSFLCKRNVDIVTEAWKQITEEQFINMSRNAIASLESQIDAVKQHLNSKD